MRAGRTVIAVVMLATLPRALGAADATDDDAGAAALAHVRSLLPAGAAVASTRVVGPAGLSFGGGDAGTRERIAVDGMPFAAAMRVRVARATVPAWTVQLVCPPSPSALAHGHVLLAACWVRAPDAAGGATGAVGLRVQLGREPWTTLAATSASPGPDWRLVCTAGMATQDFAAGDLGAAIHLGAQAQTIDVGPLVLLDLGASVDIAALPITRVSYPGREADAPWRAEAAARIDRYRKGDLTVVVRRGDGTPAADVPVSVALRRRAFGIGSFVGWKLLDDGPDGERNRAQFARFDRATIPIYWADWGWPAQRDLFERLATWGRDRGLVLRAHPLIYPGWGFLPSDVRRLASDPPALQARLLAHVREMGAAFGRFGFREVDVANELRDLTEIHALVGREGVAEWFAAARAAFPPGTKLAINENTILTNGGATAANQDRYLGWIRDLERLGQKPDVVGLQGHCNDALTPPPRLWEILDRFAATGCELQVTEFDDNTLEEEVQADYTRDFLTAVFAHPAVTAFTMWGYWAGDMWQPGAAMYRADWTAKPNGRALEALLDAWTTRASGVTDADGAYRIRGFRGDYAIVVGDGADAWRHEATLGERALVEATVPAR